MQLNPSEISELIKSRIQNLESGSELRTQGTVVSVTDGIVRVHGLAEVMQGEMLEFPGNTFGMALNLERDSVGALARPAMSSKRRLASNICCRSAIVSSSSSKAS